MKSVAAAAFLALAATANGFVVSPSATGVTAVTATSPAKSPFMSRRVAGAPTSTGALKMSTSSTSMNDGQQPTLEQWLTFAEPKLQSTMIAMFAACKEIAYKIRTASCDKMACFNEFGDEQLAIDVLANNVIFENLKACGCCATASSEETPVEDPMGGEGYSVAFDPLDGSSIIDTNFAVGTIFGVWPGNRLVGISGRELAGAGMAVYGPRTTMTVALEGMEGSHEFLLIDDFSGRHGQWVKTNSFTTIDDGKLFAPGNLRGTQDNEGYNELFNFYLDNKYQLRYTGGMVPDVNQIMVKGKGIFVNPASAAAPAKLRVLYEVGPIAYLIEKAGGKSSDGENSALDIKIPHTEVRSQVAYGSVGEVDRFESMVEITPEMVRKTAVLAQIQITDEEVEALVPRMEEFIGFVETMGEDDAGDSTMATLSCGSDFLREDAAESFSNIAAVMENMPVEERNYLRVPKVGEDEG